MLQDQVFPAEGIEVLFQDFSAIEYPQIGSRDNFIPNLCILDALFNLGPDKTVELATKGTAKWLNWEMMSLKNG